MLPSSGYFKNILCPYFKSGFCERSHCHFSHAKAASSSGKSLFGRSLPESNKDFLDAFDRANLLRSTSIEQTLQNNCGTSYREDPDDFDYIPTPVDSHVPKPKVSSILKKSKSTKYPLSTVPEYRPTPISRLKQPGAPDSGDENSRESLSVSALSKKRKKVEEYDPTEVKCSFKKRVSFNLPDDDDDDKDDSHANKGVPPCIILDSSDDDDGITPQFSDDEFEDGNVSDEACSPGAEEEKMDVMDFVAVGDTVAMDTSESMSHTPPVSEISDYSLVDKILTEVKKNETIDVHKQSLKATSAHTASSLNDQKPHKSEFKDSQKSSSGEKEKKLVLKSKQELSLESVSQSRLNDEKLHKDSTKLQGNKDNLHKRTTSDKAKAGEPPVNRSKISDKMLPDKKHQAQNQNKVTSISKTHSSSNKVTSHSEERSKSQKLKIKSEPIEVDKKDQSITKHDSLKSKSYTKLSEKGSRSIVNIKKSSKDLGKVKNTKENVKIQDEKVSSSCHASHKKTTSSEKRPSSSPPKKKMKGNSDIKSAVKLKSSPTVHKISHHPELLESDLKNRDKEIQVNVQESTEQINSIKSSPVYESSDSEVEEEVHFPMCDSDMDSDTYEECLRIFNEHEQSQEQKGKLFEVKDEKQENIMSLEKKRIAHEKAVPKPKVPKQEPLPHPSQVMHNRYLQLQGMYARQNSSDERKVSSAFINSTSKGIETVKKRITVAPNADLVAAVTQKQKLLQSSARNKSAEEITYVVTENKRVAHVPSQVLKPRPIIPVEYGCKVPSSVRQRYLNNFIDECLKFCSDQEEAYQMALEEEKKAYERSSNKTVYLNVAINTLKRLRDQAMEARSTSPPASSFNKSPEQSTTSSDARMKNKTISHEMMLGGARAQRTSYSIEKKKPKIQDTEIKGKKLYDALSTYVMTTEQLIENGYPLPHPAEPGRALVSGLYVTKRPASSDPFKKVCSRCQKPYQIDENGDYVKTEECEYHWGHLWQKRLGRSLERQYSCCGGDSQSDGCCLGPGHVFDGDMSDTLKGYVKTSPKTPPPDGYYGVYALDCEMCYTTGGIELIRVTVINPDMKPVYESFVKPENKILDYNTRFSGITEEQLSGVETSLRDVQAILLCLFNSKTILIGHSLESDFKALKLIHTTVVDTSIVFPHKRGLPYKRALRTLMAEYMRKIIQNSLEGHDSNEDAVACMELMMWKIKEDMKRSR